MDIRSNVQSVARSQLFLCRLSAMLSALHVAATSGFKKGRFTSVVVGVRQIERKGESVGSAKPWFATTLAQMSQRLGVPLDQLASVVISLVVILLSVIRLGPVSGFLSAFLSLIWPLALIWFSDEIGSYTGRFRSQCVSQEAHPSFVKLLGWIVLLIVVGKLLHEVFWT